MPDLPLKYPVGGLNDNYATDAQPPATTRDAQNERSVDPVTNRIRGGQRAGLSKFCSTRLGAGAVRGVQQVTYDARQTDYSTTSTSAAGDLSEWSVALENGESCSAVAHDSQGNVYAVDGTAAISKYNRDGERVYTFALPVKDESHVVRALDIDFVDRVYVGVSEGGSQAGAWIRCYVPDSERNLVKLWEVSPGAYTERIVVRDDKLYAALNKTDESRSYYVVYEGLSSAAGPDAAFAKAIPYPVNDLAVKDTGEVYTAHGPRTGTGTDNRFYDSRVPTHTAILDEQRWNPTMLDSWDERKWIWMSAEDLDLDDGDDVNEWPDTRGRGIAIFRKDVTQPTSGSNPFKAPRFKAHGLGYKPTVQFDGDLYRLVSDGSVGGTESANEFQPTLLPGRGKGYAIVMVVQMEVDSTKIGRLFSQQNSNGGGYRECYINAVGSSAAAYGTGTDGAISVRAGQRLSPTPSAPSVPPSTNTLAGYATNSSSSAIITIVSENNELSASTSSYFRVNGVPITRWGGNKFWTSGGLLSILGCNADGSLGPTCSISEIMVLQSYDDAGTEKIATCPDVSAWSDYGALDSGTAGTADDSTSDTEIERIEGYFAWKYGLSHLLDSGTDAGGSGVGSMTWDDTECASIFQHAFTSNAASDNVANTLAAPPNPGGRDADDIDVKLLGNVPETVKWTAQRGNTKWVYTTGGGMGYAVALASDDYIYTVGPRVSGAISGGNSAAVRRFRDTGSSVSTSAATSWFSSIKSSPTTATDYTYEHPRIAVDSFDNLYVPFHATGAQTKYSMLVFASNAPTSGGIAQPFLSYQANSGTVRSGRCVSIDPRQPDYTGNTTTVDRPEYVSLGLEVSAKTATSLHSVRLVDSTANNGSPRAVEYVGVVSGDIVRFGSDGTATTISSGALSSVSRYIASVNAFGKVFFADGVNYRVYDPKEGTVARWNATDGGSILPRFRLLTSWRGRMVLARGNDDPQNWQMSEAGNPYGWDFFPPDSPIATQAVVGNQAEIGMVPDVITALIPYDRERLIFGCDHTIYMMWGDPMENGSIVLVSDITGMSLGPSWAKDSDGIVYFFGSRGGVYAFLPSGAVQKISSETIDRRLQDVDMDAYVPTLVWDEDLRELRVFMCAKVIGAVTAAHWAWCKRTNSWHQDKFSVSGVQPTSVAVFDSDDPEDRVVVLGCEDGYVRKIDRDAASDDGHTIDSWVTVGPFSDRSMGVRLRDPRIVLARTQQGCRVELGATDTPDADFMATASADLVPGDNPRKLMGVRGSHGWLRLRNAAPGTRWAYESGTVGVYPAGRRVTLDG